MVQKISVVRKIDHKLTVYGTEDNCLKRDLWDLWDLWDWGTCDESHDYKQEGRESEFPPTKIVMGSGIGVASYH